jgi:hypothetical protein
MKKRLFVFFFILLVFHIGLAIPKTKFECSCHVYFPESFSTCCNCPYCVSQRGGFLSACGCHGKTERSPENLPSIKRSICFCGYPGADFDLPGVKFPVLVGQNLCSPLTIEIHNFSPVSSILSSQVYLTPPNHPS